MHENKLNKQKLMETRIEKYEETIPESLTFEYAYENYLLCLFKKLLSIIINILIPI